MNLLNEVREEVLEVFKTVHETYYPSMLVNYPNFGRVDTQHQTDPFVEVGIRLMTEQSALGEREIQVEGSLNVYYYVRENTGGLKEATEYCDRLNNEAGLRNFGDVFFHQFTFDNGVEAYPKWTGFLFRSSFISSKGNTC